MSGHIETIRSTDTASKISFQNTASESNPVGARKPKLAELLLSTEIRGFEHVVNKTTHAIERYLWILIILTCFVFAVKDTTDLVLSYLRQPTTTHAVVVYNSSIILSDLNLCVTLERQSYAHTVSPWNSTAVLIYLKRFENEPEILPKLAEPDKRDLLIFTTLLLQDITRLENYVTAKHPSFSNSNLTSTPSSIPVHQFYRRKKIRFDELVSAVGAALCKAFEIQIVNVLTDSLNRAAEELPQDVCHGNGTLNWIGRQPAIASIRPKAYVCWRIPKPVYFESLDDSLEISLQPYNLYDPLRKLSGDDIGFLDLKRRAIPVAFGVYSIKLFAAQYDAVAITLLGHYKQLNLQRTPCTIWGDKQECKGTCWPRLQRAKCGCWHLSWFAYIGEWEWDSTPVYCIDQDLPEILAGNSNLNLSSYYQLLKEVENGSCYAEGADERQRIETNPECVAQCVHPCDTKLFSISDRNSMQRLSDNENATGISLKLLDFSHPVFEEKLIFSNFRYFLAQFGGILVFWLGAHLLAFISVVMFAIRGVLWGIAHSSKDYVYKSEGGQEETVVKKTTAPGTQ